MSAVHDAAAIAEVAAAAHGLPDYERGAIELVRRRIGFDVAMFKRAGGLRDVHAMTQHVILSTTWLHDAGRVSVGAEPMVPMFSS